MNSNHTYVALYAISDCGDPNPANATRNDTDFAYGSVIEIMCDSGYDIIGSSTIICQADGTWSDYPICNPSGKVFILYLRVPMPTIVLKYFF